MLWDTYFRRRKKYILYAETIMKKHNKVYRYLVQHLDYELFRVDFLSWYGCLKM